MLVNPSIYNLQGRYNNNYDLRTLEKQNSYTAAIKAPGISYKNSLTDQINRVSLQKVSDFDSKFKTDLKALHAEAKKLSKADSGVYDSRKAVEQSSSFDIAAKDGATIGNFEVKIDQVATAQTNKSESKAASSPIAQDFSGTLEIKQGDSVKKLDLTLQEGETVSESYLRVAKQINSANTGVKASVQTDDQGYSQLVLQSKETGTSSGFEVSGTFSDQLKLGQNQSDAQNLKYQVNNEAKESQSNVVSLDKGKLTLTAKTTNEKPEEVDVEASSTSVVSSLKAFADSFNKFIADQKDTDNPLTKSIVKQFTNTVSKSLEQLNIDGIKMESGKIAIDESKLSQAIESKGDDLKAKLTKFDSMASNLTRKTEQVLDLPLKDVSPNYSNHNYPIKAFMYNYNANFGLSNLNQLTNNGSIMDFKI